MCKVQISFLRIFIFDIIVFSKGDNAKTRSSRPEVFCEEGVLRNLTKFTGKHLCLF